MTRVSDTSRLVAPIKQTDDGQNSSAKKSLLSLHFLMCPSLSVHLTQM